MKIRDFLGVEREAVLIGNPDAPYLEYEYKVTENKYNPNYGDDRMCVCGHTYKHHFDSYENMEPVGCKYCGCNEFVEKMITDKNNDEMDDRIECLIDELVDARREALGEGNCPYYGEHLLCEENNNNCDECKDNYFEKMRTELMEEYEVG